MASRTLTFSIFRHNPADPDDGGPRMEEHTLDETPALTLFLALNRIREEQDPSLQFDFSCRSAVCGSCGMLVNGQPRLACNTRTEQLGTKITLLPLPFFKLVADLSVDTGTWFREMGERVGSWIHTVEEFDPEAPEERMSNEEAQLIYELDRCIECGCCLPACMVARAKPEFIGATGMLRVARFLVDPREQRPDPEIFEVVGTEEGVFGCVGLLGCQDFCPKDLPLQTQIAYLRRKMTLAALRPQSTASTQPAS
ncbi:MAG: succinate dehydrogenase/fumarate reductase iron-sulfur subunit [Dehalococcoidia bacterium]|nr:succinate dehydrogenase/fumarate reductase iron-sulfur subunit [Dehalococcoidia bacterium]